MVEVNTDEGCAYEPSWMEVGLLAELPPGTPMPLVVGDEILTLVNTGTGVVAIGGVCLRCSRSLSTATYAGERLICPGCGWKYDLQRGCVAGLCELKIEVHDVRVEDGRLLLPAAVAAPVPPS